MWRYILAHWRGEQSLPRSVFLNWLLVYLLLGLLAGSAKILSIRASRSFVWIVVGFMLIWLVWAVVGVLRRGWRVLGDPSLSLLRKIGATIAILAATAFTIVAARDFYHVFYYYARPIPGGSGIRAAMLHSAASSWWISARRDVR